MLLPDVSQAPLSLEESYMRSVAVVLAIVGLSANVAFAADPPSNGSLRSACKADVEKLCSGVERGHGRIAACLKQNEAQLSAPCKDAIAKSHPPKAPSGSSSPKGSPQT
jgi:hypothetical protein